MTEFYSHDLWRKEYEYSRLPFSYPPKPYPYIPYEPDPYSYAGGTTHMRQDPLSNLDRKALLGARGLFVVDAERGRHRTFHGSVEEFRVLEFSPSEQWVRLMNTDGLKIWHASHLVFLVEMLRPLNTEPRPLESRPLTSEEIAQGKGIGGHRPAESTNKAGPWASPREALDNKHDLA